MALLDADVDEAAERFADLIESGRTPGGLGYKTYVYDLASDTALLAGDLESARKYALATDPILGSDTTSRVDRLNTDNAVKLAYIEQREGNADEARRLLMEALAVVRELPRLGTFGFGIRDVQIYALLGRKEEAIAAFRDALDGGYRGSIMFDGWPVAVDPYIDRIRDDPRFIAMLDELDGYLAVMRDNVFDAESANQLDKLRALAETI